MEMSQEQLNDLKNQVKQASEKLSRIGELLNKEEPITVEIDGQEFKIRRPVITESINEYDENGKVIRTEVDTNAILVGGGEEKRVSTYEYSKSGMPTKVISTSSSKKDAISEMEYDDQDRIIRATTPISIIEKTYDDENKTQTVVTRDILSEVTTIEEAEFIDGEYRNISVKSQSATDEDKGEMTYDYDIENDAITIVSTGVYGNLNGEPITTKLSYKTRDVIETDHTIYGEYKNIYLVNVRDEKGRLTKVQLFDNKKENLIAEFDYELEELDDTTYIVKNQYESICVKKDDHLSFVDVIQYDPKDGTLLNAIQTATYDNYKMATTIIYNSNTSEKGYDRYFMSITDSDNKFSLYYNAVYRNIENIQQQSIEFSFIYNNKKYFVNFNDEITYDISVADVIDEEIGDIKYQKEVYFPPRYNDQESVKEIFMYFYRIFDDYIETNETLKELLSMSKVMIVLREKL